MTVVTKRLE